MNTDIQEPSTFSVDARDSLRSCITLDWNPPIFSRFQRASTNTFMKIFYFEISLLSTAKNKRWQSLKSEWVEFRSTMNQTGLLEM